MPDYDPKEAGDDVYPAFNNTVVAFIKNAVAVTKGNIMTKDAADRLVAVTGASSIADLTKGIYQAKATVAAPSAEDTDTVECLTPGSWLVLKADANLTPGNEVELKCVTTTVTPDKVMAAASPRTKGFLGRIHKILTSTDGSEKRVTADDDLVVVITRA